jgi:hypothetical protein
MSTIYTFHNETDAGTLATGDTLLVYDVSAARTRKTTVGQLMSDAAAVVSTTATTIAITAASHANRTLLVNSTAPAVITLPAASGTGAVYRIVMGVAATATETTIKVANATDVMKGYVFCVTTSSDNAEGFKTTATSDSIEMNGTTKGGVIGDHYELIDVATGIWIVRGFSAPTGSEATPFDATV